MSASPFHNQSPDFFIKGILDADIAILSRAITLSESGRDDHRQLAGQIIDGIIHKTGNSFRLGITGVPGVGKSTFIESFGNVVLKKGHKLAVLAIDPSSTKSKGSILGDKTRMESLSTAKNVFIRPSPSGGALGGVTRTTYETMLLCEAAGFDFIIIETVGVGQSEVAVSRITDFFLLLMLAGAGDELQGIKRGIMEMADALVITKADGANHQKAKAARADYAHAMHLLQEPESGWPAQTMICSAIENYGIDNVYTVIKNYRQFVTANNYFFEKRKLQQSGLLLNAVDERLREHFYKDESMQEKIKLASAGNVIHPFTTAKELVDSFFNFLRSS